MNAMNNEPVILSLGPASGHRPVVMRGPADMAELLPYLLGFHPDDSIVAVGLQGPDLHQGGVIRADLPDSPAQWSAAADETAALLVALSERHGGPPVQVLLYLCQDSTSPHAPPAAEGLRPLADDLRAAFARRGVAVKESLCVSDGRWWSFLCRGEGCCDPAGTPVRSGPAPGPAAAAATVAGLVPRGSRKAIVGALAPIGPPEAEAQRAALERALAGTVSREQGAALLDQAFAEFAAGGRELDEERAARLLVALRDRLTRDRGVEYARPAELAPAERLWRFLARRAVPPYEDCAVPPLTLLAWASWVAGDTATARVVLGHVLRLAPGYLLAELLYESLNDGLAPQALMTAVEAQRRRREAREGREAVAPVDPPEEAPGQGPATGAPAGRRRRRGGRRKGGARLAAAGGNAPEGGTRPAPGGASAGEPEPESGPVAVLPPPRCAPEADRSGERPARGVRLGRQSACASAEARRAEADQCRGTRRAGRGGRHAR
ncbi:DUF4192 domain-containing protein [Streptomyces sp. NRRL WC-3742]|uniref:DUF4192 domain-containing protein n=1 Tax=Streptomyces sp. NRRL WC-3742 TaxID=1463934 RepID=UPI00068BB419|nr:DUF4192 domain-containing protein [Streptomyces sp. NRRL WC-3742]